MSRANYQTFTTKEPNNLHPAVRCPVATLGAVAAQALSAAWMHRRRWPSAARRAAGSEGLRGEAPGAPRGAPGRGRREAAYPARAGTPRNSRWSASSSTR